MPRGQQGVHCVQGLLGEARCGVGQVWEVSVRGKQFLWLLHLAKQIENIVQLSQNDSMILCSQSISVIATMHLMNIWFYQSSTVGSLQFSVFLVCFLQKQHSTTTLSFPRKFASSFFNQRSPPEDQKASWIPPRESLPVKNTLTEWANLLEFLRRILKTFLKPNILSFGFNSCFDLYVFPWRLWTPQPVLSL